MDYRSYYEKMCDLKIPRNCEIHHINFNREDNNIRNLVMLPSKLHKDYHKKLENLKNSRFKLDEQIKSIIDFGINYNDFVLSERYKEAKAFVEVWYECIPFVSYRDYKLGHYIPDELVEKVEVQLYGKDKSTQI